MMSLPMLLAASISAAAVMEPAWAYGQVLGLSGGGPLAIQPQPGAPQGPALTAQPVPRRDLALALNDLPPGYEEAESLDLQLFETPLADRVIRRTNPGPGPAWIWTMTFQPATPMTQARMDFLADDLSVLLTRATADVALLSRWSIGASDGLGALARVYTFSFHAKGEDVNGDGTLALFGTPDYTTYMVVLNTDGRSASDLRDLARIVGSRVDAARGAAVAP
jgi:hypothetical protein